MGLIGTLNDPARLAAFNPKLRHCISSHISGKARHYKWRIFICGLSWTCRMASYIIFGNFNKCWDGVFFEHSVILLASNREKLLICL